MQITIIAPENSMYFEGLLGKYWKEKEANDMCIGLIDDKGKAVCGAAFRVTMQQAQLLFIATDKAYRNRGYASMLLTKMKDHFQKKGLKQIRAMIMQEKDSIEEGHLLQKLGYVMRETDTRRLCYRLGDFQSKVKQMPGDEYQMKKVSELTTGEIASFQELVEKQEGKRVYLETSLFLKQKDNYSLFLVRKEEIITVLHAAGFADGVLIDSVYMAEDKIWIAGALAGELKSLLDTNFTEDTNIYFDLYGERLEQFVRHLWKKEPKQMWTAQMAVLGL